MRAVQTGSGVAVAATATLLAALSFGWPEIGAQPVLGTAGWLVGIGCALVLAVALRRGITVATASAEPDGMPQADGATGTDGATRTAGAPRTDGLLVPDRVPSRRRLGPANWITLTRAVLVCAIAALVASAIAYGGHPRLPLIVLTSIALALDAVDGWAARRTRTVSPLGARFDMEVDSFLILVLSVYAARQLGPWVLAIGLARYAFAAAAWVLPWMDTAHRALPPRHWRKVVAATQGIVLAYAAADPSWRPLTIALVAGALALLAESFGRDVWWLRAHRTVPDARPEPAGPAEPAAGPARPAAPRRVVRVTLTTLAVALVWAALVAPNRLDRLTPLAFLRIPVEGLAIGALMLVAPRRARRPLALCAGALLGVIVVVKLLDIGFQAALDRPFNPVTDWGNLGPAIGVLRDSVGATAAIASTAGLTVIVIGLIAAIALAAARLARLGSTRRTASLRAMTALATVWCLCAAMGARLTPAEPVAATSAAGIVYEQGAQVGAGLRDRAAFAAAQRHDPYRDASGSTLLGGLRGKDVIIAFVESYGRVAVQDSSFSGGVDAVLDQGTASLARSGFQARSGFLTSPTFGGISWLAHSTLQSGLWINNQQRYNSLVSGDRFTLSDAFRRAGWRTVGDVPSNHEDWQQGTSFYHYDKIYDARNVGYAGPNFSYASMPDQYILSAFQQRELAGPHAPVMAEIDLVSSHTPWAPLPRLVPWDQVGDGSIFDPMPAQGQPAHVVWRDARDVQAAYGQSIQYSLSTLVSFVQTYPDPNLVLIVLGDHEPATIVSGSGASHDVPISIIAHDPAVLSQVAGWHWTAGLRPDRNAPVWRMDTFRDRFLGAYSQPQVYAAK